jgi:hypothetical protein
VDTCPGKGVFYTRYEYVLENGSAQVQKTLLGIKPTGSGRPYIMDFEKSPSDAEASFSPHQETPYPQLPRFTLMRSLDVSLVLNAGSRLSVFVGICHAPGQDFLIIERKG